MDVGPNLSGLAEMSLWILFSDLRASECEVILTPEKALLAKLEEENRRIEADAKCPSLTNVHSRKSSDTSQISLASGKFICCLKSESILFYFSKITLFS